MVIKELLFVAAAPVMLRSGGLYAQDQGWYMGVGIGQSHTTEVASCSTLNRNFPGFPCHNKSTSTGARLSGGYQFNENVGLEASYVNLGKFTMSSSGTFGIGVKYDLGGNIGVRAELQRFQSIGNSTTGKADVDSISASVVYRFK